MYFTISPTFSNKQHVLVLPNSHGHWIVGGAWWVEQGTQNDGMVKVLDSMPRTLCRAVAISRLQVQPSN